MNLDIGHLAVTLEGVSPDLGSHVSALLGDALRHRLSALGAGPGLANDITHADLGTIEAPAGADAQALSELIAAQLVDWIAKEVD